MKIKYTLSKPSKPLMLSFVLLFVIVGVYFVYQSFAGKPLPNGADETIIEMIREHSEVGSVELLTQPETLPFRLYGNGLAICGDYADSDTTHSAQYYSKQFTKSELNNFVAKFNQAKFVSLDQMYVSSPRNAIANNARTITFNTVDSSTQVTTFLGDSAVPQGFTKAEMAINELCASMTQPYSSDNVSLRTKKVPPKLVANSPTEEVPSEIETPVKDEVVHVQSNVETSSAKNIAKKIAGSKGSKFYKTADGVVQVVVSQQLPYAKQKVPTNKKSHQTKTTMGMTSVSASAGGTVRFALFCPNNGCNQYNIDAYMNSVRDWYRSVQGKTFDVQKISIVNGSHPASYYQSQDSTVVFQRIFNEIYDKKMFKSASPIQLITGFSLGPRSWCGVANIPPNFTSQYALAITDFSPPSSSAVCAGNTTSGTGFEYRVVAHELGHNFTLTHTTGQGQAGGIMGYDYACNWPACSLNALQSLYLQSNPLFYVSGPVGIAGQVSYGGKPIGGMQIETCTGQYPTTNNDNGYFLWSTQGGSGFCIRNLKPLTGVSGPATNNNNENKNSKTYEYQIAGRSCYHICGAPQYSWDLGVDYLFNFRYAEAKSLALKPGSSQGQKLDSWGKLFGFNGASSGGGIKWRDWNIARSVALNSAGQGYVLDGFGGLHPFGGIAAATGGPYWRGWDIARDVKFVPGTNKGYVLDGLGPIHPFNGASTSVRGQSSFQSDLAKKIVIKGDGLGGYMLDGWGGIHPFAISGTSDTNPLPKAASGHAYWPGWDIARSIVMNPAGTKGYVLDGWGGIHPFRTGTAGLPPRITNAPSWVGWDIARDIVITDWNTAVPTGYVLDGYGGTHKFDK